MAQKKGKKHKGVEIDTKQPNRNKCSGFNIILVTTSLLTLIFAALSFQVYTAITTVPKLPEFDLDVWWGPNTTSKQDTSIRRYRIVFTERMQDVLRHHFDIFRRSTRKKSLKDVAWTYGVNSEALAQIFAHWQFKYKYPDRERYLNKFDHFKTNIQGLDVHYIHVKPAVGKKVKVLPLLMLHGWPGTVREFYDVIPLLTTVRPGYDFVFEVIAPSLPGFLFSQAPVKPGLSPYETAIIMRNLMQRLGFTHYYIQGGDFGHVVGSNMAILFPKEVLGFHTSFPVNISKFGHFLWILSNIWAKLGVNVVTDKINYLLEEFGNLHLQGTKPDTIGIALQDSPMGLAAYILDKLMVFTDPNNKLLEDGGLSKYFTPSAIVDIAVLYWTTESITTSMRHYKEYFGNDVEKLLSQVPTPVPTWGLRLKNDLLDHSDCILRWKYPNLVGTTYLDHGGHFAAFEIPNEFADDVFQAVKKILTFEKKE